LPPPRRSIEGDRAVLIAVSDSEPVELPLERLKRRDPVET
jgi:hypothetical protein